MKKATLGLWFVALLLAAPAQAQTCNRTATPATFNAKVAAAVNGDTICLAPGDYGTWSGTSKAITVTKTVGQKYPSLKYNFGSGDGNFVLNAVKGTGGTMNAGAHDITIQRSYFRDYAVFNSGPTPNVVLSRDTFARFDSPPGAPNARIGIYYGAAHSGISVLSSTLAGGDSDGIHTGAGVTVIGNTFTGICDRGGNHTDQFQSEGAPNVVIRGNFIQANCTTQGITSFDSPAPNASITNNVVDIPRAWGIEWYADSNSVIRHNTLVWRSATCYAGHACGQVGLFHKSGQPAGHGTIVRDNVTTGVAFDAGTTFTADHNVSGQNVTYRGPLDTYAGFRLASGSVGSNAASDGTDVGIP